MKRPAGRLVIAFLIAIVYLLWHPEPTRRELTVDPLWALRPASAPVDATARAEAPGDDMIPFVSRDVFGYLTVSGQLAYRGRSSYRVALSSHAFVNASRGSQQLVIQDTSGGFVATVPTSGDPIFVGNRLFVVSEGGGLLSEWGVDGTLLWRLPLEAPLLSLAANDSHTVIGVAAGGAVLLDAGGDQLELERLAARVEPLVYSVALSDTLRGLAVVSSAAGPVGANASATDARAEPAEERVAATLTLYDLTAGRGVPVVRRSIARDPRAEPVVRFPADGSTLLYTDARPDPVLVMLGVDDGDEHRVALDYPATDVVELALAETHATLQVGTERDPARSFARPAGLVLATRSGTVPVRVTWAADESWIHQAGAVTVLGVDDRVLGLTVEVR